METRSESSGPGSYPIGGPLLKMPVGPAALVNAGERSGSAWRKGRAPNGSWWTEHAPRRCVPAEAVVPSGRRCRARRSSVRAPRSCRIVLTLPGPPRLYCAPCPVPVSEATPGEQDAPRAGGKAEQKSQHEHCQPLGKYDMRSYLRVPERRPGQRARRGDPHPDAAVCSVSRGDRNPAAALLPIRRRPACHHPDRPRRPRRDLPLRVALHGGRHQAPGHFGVLLPHGRGVAPVTRRCPQHGRGDQEHCDQPGNHGRLDPVDAPPERVTVPAEHPGLADPPNRGAAVRGPRSRYAIRALTGPRHRHHGGTEFVSAAMPGRPHIPRALRRRACSLPSTS